MLKSGSEGPPILLFFGKTVVTVLGCLHFHMKYRISLSVSRKRTSWVLIRIALILYIDFDENQNLTVVFPIHEHGI